MLRLKTRTAGVVLAAFGFVCSLLGAACSGTPGAQTSSEAAPAAERPGVLTLQLSGTAALGGFLVEVTGAGGIVVTAQLVAASGEETTTSQLVLPPGKYTVTSTPMRAPGELEERCRAASHDVTIKPAETSQLTLASRCESPNPGGLQVGFGTNFAPSVLSAIVDPSTTLAACQSVTVSLSASDRDGDALSCNATLDDGTPVIGKPTADPVPHATDCAFTLAPNAGEHMLRVRACDASQCAVLDVPLHVSEGDCSVRCDDGDPCTKDDASAEGFCSHTPAPNAESCAGNE